MQREKEIENSIIRINELYQKMSVNEHDLVEPASGLVVPEDYAHYEVDLTWPAVIGGIMLGTSVGIIAFYSFMTRLNQVEYRVSTQTRDAEPIPGLFIAAWDEDGLINDKNPFTDESGVTDEQGSLVLRRPATEDNIQLKPLGKTVMDSMGVEWCLEETQMEPRLEEDKEINKVLIFDKCDD